MSRDHRKLRAFKLIDALVLRVYQVTRRFPDSERFSLTSQLRRAVVSAAANIVEGAARRTQNDYLHFLNVALGSPRETGYLLDLAARLGCMAPEERDRLMKDYDVSASSLATLIRSLSAR